MVKQKDIEGNFVKKETMYIVALIALVVGFLGGIFYSAMEAGPNRSAQISSSPAGPSPQQQAQSQNMSSEQAKNILSLEQAVAADPTNVQAWTNLGHVYFDTNNPPKAIRAYEKSLELNPANPNVLTDLGVMYRRIGQPAKALELFEKAMALDPMHQQSRFNKGIVLRYDMDDREGAVKAWEDLLRVNPAATAPNGMPLSEAIKNL